MTSALEWGEWSAARPGHTLPPGKNRYPLYRRLGGPQGWSGQGEKSRPLPGFDPRTVQPVVSRYTDWATRPTQLICTGIILKVQLSLYTPWRQGGEWKYQLYSFLILALDRGVWLASCPGCFTPAGRGKSLNHPVGSLVTIPTALSWFLVVYTFSIKVME
jgi:hypothetical protein